MEVEIKDSEDHPVVLFQLQGDTVKVTEMCDLWYSSTMNKAEFGELLDTLAELYDNLED